MGQAEKLEEEEKIVAIVDDEGEDQDSLENDASDDDEKEESRLGASEVEEEDDDEDDDDDDVRSRRRDERKTRRHRQKEARERNQKELNFLRARNDELERRFSTLESRLGAGEVQQIDGQINTLKSQINLANQVMAKAVDQGKGSDLVEAQKIRDTLISKLSNLEQQKQRTTISQRTPKVDPQLVSHAESWMKKNSWWDPNGGDEDSMIVSAIDTALAKEGMDPRTSEYWDELDRRVKKRLPDKFKSNGKSSSNKGGPQFRTGGRERGLKKNEVYISPDRKRAMIEAGVWEDPILRQRYLKQYAAYDRQNND